MFPSVQPPPWFSALMERMEDLELQVEVATSENAELKKKAEVNKGVITLKSC